ncbi:ATP-binding protein [Rhodococcus gannanensis]|uniref:histidine kinase n=1 Tax=Rhodococcus gannanensis TaxID=1960308 RepID=A0ABW4P700_9NOCA
MTASDPAVPDIPDCTPTLLRSLFLFEKLDDDQIAELCRVGRIEVIEPGLVYAEGEPATCFYVLLEGTVVLTKLSGSHQVETARTDHRGAYAGAWTAYMGDRVPQVYAGSMTVPDRATFYVLDAGDFARLMADWFPMALHLLEGLFFGNRNAREILDQRERLLALGSLSAGLTHELNNPAAAAVRATSELRDRVVHMRHKLGLIASGAYDPAVLQTLIRIQEEAVELVGKAPTLTPMEESDREDELGDWLGDHGIEGAWTYAPTFVQAGFDVAWLERVAAAVDSTILASAVGWLAHTIETELLMREITDSTSRITALVGAAKQYSQLDRAPVQVADVHDLLDSTLVMLSGKIGKGVDVDKDYDRALPAIPVNAAELNQVWTNLIDNAVGAMRGTGTLTVRTRRVGDVVEVVIGDTGEGIPDDVRGRIFEPFFTTKSVGEGTGLGLDISWRIVDRHGGDIGVESRPGRTEFTVRLPVDGSEGESNE